jgi:hypothetical protein
MTLTVKVLALVVRAAQLSIQLVTQLVFMIA